MRFWRDPSIHWRFERFAVDLPCSVGPVPSELVGAALSNIRRRRISHYIRRAFFLPSLPFLSASGAGTAGRAL
jgi:hypothetical protein